MKYYFKHFIVQLLLLFIVVVGFAQDKVSNIDPVCKMQVDNNNISYTYKDKEYFFCTASCKQQFVANPEAILEAKLAQSCLDQMPDYADSVNLGIIIEDKLKGSPRRKVCKSFGEEYLSIDYGSPGLKGRIIWGGLVPYDIVWAGGAHTATKLTVMGNITIDKKELLGGEYALFFIPGKAYWTIIINENHKQHLADDYDQARDIMRIKVKPKVVKQSTQRLTYLITAKNKKEGVISLKWDQLSVDLPFKMID